MCGSAGNRAQDARPLATQEQRTPASASIGSLGKMNVGLRRPPGSSLKMALLHDRIAGPQARNACSTSADSTIRSWAEDNIVTHRLSSRTTPRVRRALSLPSPKPYLVQLFTSDVISFLRRPARSTITCSSSRICTLRSSDVYFEWCHVRRIHCYESAGI